MHSFELPEYCENLTRKEILAKLRSARRTLHSEMMENRKLVAKLKAYETAPRLKTRAQGGWWYLTDYPKGAGASRKAGEYIRDPFQRAVIKLKKKKKRR